MEISAKEFMRMQPNTKKVTEAEKYYMLLATRLAKRWDDCDRFTDLSDSERQAVVLAVVGYFQDIVTDAGIWRSFTMMHEHLYGKPLPFFPRSENYIDYELNLDDLRFLIWYALEGQHYKNFNISHSIPTLSGLPRSFIKSSTRCMKLRPTRWNTISKQALTPKIWGTPTAYSNSVRGFSTIATS